MKKQCNHFIRKSVYVEETLTGYLCMDCSELLPVNPQYQKMKGKKRKKKNKFQSGINLCNKIIDLLEK